MTKYEIAGQALLGRGPFLYLVAGRLRYTFPITAMLVAGHTKEQAARMFSCHLLREEGLPIPKDLNVWTYIHSFEQVGLLAEEVAYV